MLTKNLINAPQRPLLWLAFWSVALLALAGCAPRYATGEMAAPEGEQLAIDLPAIVVDVDEEGQLSAAGAPLADLGAALGQDFSTLSLPASLVSELQAADIQHLQLASNPDGVAILVNGQEMPTIGWGEGSLDAAGQLLSGLGVVETEVGELLQVLEQAGLGAVVSLPLAAGAEEIPLTATAPSEAVAEAQETQERFLASVGGNVPEIALTINYDSSGEASLQGISSVLLNLLGVSLDALDQDPALIQQLNAANVDTVNLQTSADGAFISVNGEELPYLDWSDGKMASAVDLLADAGLLDAVSDNPTTRNAILGLIRRLLPVIQAVNLDLTLNFE